MCLYPKLIKNRKYLPNKKNGGNVPPLPLVETEDGRRVNDYRVMAVPVGCGRCIECMKQKSRNWQARLLEEIRSPGEKAYMVTFTFNDEWLTKYRNKHFKLKGYDLDNAIAKTAVHEFLERWRKKHKKSIRHWLVTELGQKNTEHMHLHGIVWTDKDPKDINDIWRNGFTFIGDYVNARTVNYIVKYIHKSDELHKEYKPVILSSPGIGKGYLDRIDYKRNKFKGKETKEDYINNKGYKMAMPIYWRNKIYTEEEREKTMDTEN